MSTDLRTVPKSPRSTANRYRFSSFVKGFGKLVMMRLFGLPIPGRGDGTVDSTWSTNQSKQTGIVSEYSSFVPVRSTSVWIQLNRTWEGHWIGYSPLWKPWRCRVFDLLPRHLCKKMNCGPPCTLRNRTMMMSAFSNGTLFLPLHCGTAISASTTDTEQIA